MNSEKFSSPPPPLPIEELKALTSFTNKQSNAAPTPPVPMPVAEISASSVAPPVPVLPEQLPATIAVSSSNELPVPKSVEQLVAETKVAAPMPMSFQELSQISRR